MLNTEVIQVAAGRTQKAGVTRSGRLILWEVSRLAVALDWRGWEPRHGVGVLRSYLLLCRPHPWELEAAHSFLGQWSCLSPSSSLVSWRASQV